MDGTEGLRARSWLKDHGFADRELTTLLARRLQARHRAHVYLGFGTMGSTLAAVVVLQTRSTSVQLIGSITLVAVVLATRWLERSRRRAVERDVAATLPMRVTHTVPSTAVEVIGAGYLCAATLLYAVPVLLLLAAGGSGVVWAAVVVTAMLAVLDAVEVAALVRRPALAHDARSLAVDDALRTEDARSALLPIVPLLLCWTALEPALEPSPTVLTMAALVGLLLVLSMATQYARPSRRPVPTA